MEPNVDVDSRPDKAALAIRKIIVAADLTNHSSQTVDCAAALALRYNARVQLLHVIDPSFFWIFPLEGIADEPARIHEQMSARLSALASSLRQRGVACEAAIREGSIRDVIGRLAGEGNFDLLMLGAHRPGSLRQLAFGSTFNNIIHQASCPVITVGPAALPISGTEPHRFERILFATDFSAASSEAAKYVAALKKANGCGLIVTRVRTHHERYCDAQHLKYCVRELVPALTNVDFAAVPLNGDPVRALSHLSRTERADLIVMGVKRASRAANMLSDGVAHEIICRVQCPVLTIACEARVHAAQPAFIDELAGTLV
jgi:nucleotide-binding universal stress UspA family protein